jgi:hypothetical protein
LSTLAVLYGHVRRLPEPHARYRVHGENGYASLGFDDRLPFDSAIFDYVSNAAVEFCSKLNIRVDPRMWKTKSWMHRIHEATRDIANLVPSGEAFILVDEDGWGTGPVLAGRKRIPFLERDGQYWGKPPDDVTAIAELERLRESGASFMVFAWPAFWWLDHYSGLRQYLRGEFPCVLENDCVAVFDLRKGNVPR